MGTFLTWTSLWWLGWQGSAPATGCSQNFDACCGQRKLPPAKKRKISREKAANGPQLWHPSLQDLGIAVMKAPGRGLAGYIANTLLAWMGKGRLFLQH